MHNFVPYPYPSEIDKDMLAELPRASYTLPIHIIDHIDTVPSAIARLSAADVLGIDTETKPSFVPGRRTMVSLLQVATDSETFLFRLNKIGLPHPLLEILEREDILKVGLSLRDDCTALKRLAAFEPRGFVELQILAPGYGIRDASLQKIYAIMFGEAMSKAQRMSNWEANKLTPAQQSYAALDAWGSLRIYRKLMRHTPPTPTQFALI